MNKTIGQTYFLKVKELNLDGGSRTDFAADIIDLELHPERERERLFAEGARTSTVVVPCESVPKHPSQDTIK